MTRLRIPPSRVYVSLVHWWALISCSISLASCGCLCSSSSVLVSLLPRTHTRIVRNGSSARRQSVSANDVQCDGVVLPHLQLLSQGVELLLGGIHGVDDQVLLQRQEHADKFAGSGVTIPHPNSAIATHQLVAVGVLLRGDLKGGLWQLGVLVLGLWRKQTRATKRIRSQPANQVLLRSRQAPHTSRTSTAEPTKRTRDL